jgi:hypothetical protein
MNSQDILIIGAIFVLAGSIVATYKIRKLEKKYGIV